MAITEILDDVVIDSPERLSNKQRLTTGLSQSVSGPFNVGRAVTGLGWSAVATVLRFLSSLVQSARTKVAESDLTTKLADNFGSEPEPEPTPLWRQRPVLIALVITAVLAVGGAAFKLLRTPPAPPVAAAPPRVQSSSGATGDSSPSASEELEEAVEDALDQVEIPAEDDLRKRGE